MRKHMGDQRKPQRRKTFLISLSEDASVCFAAPPSFPPVRGDENTSSHPPPCFCPCSIVTPAFPSYKEMARKKKKPPNVSFAFQWHTRWPKQTKDGLKNLPFSQLVAAVGLCPMAQSLALGLGYWDVFPLLASLNLSGVLHPLKISFDVISL